MATNSAPFPAHGESPYGSKVKVYIDTGDAAVEDAAKADATAKVTAHEAKTDPHPQYDRLLATQQGAGGRDANTFTTPGRYYILTHGGNTNFPTTAAGFLEVVARENQGTVGPHLTQAYQIMGTGLYHTRSVGSGDTWTAWQKTSVNEHEAQSNPHTQYARLAASNIFSSTQIVANSGIQQVLRRNNAPTDSQVWVTYVETEGTLKFRPYNDVVSTTNGTPFDVFRDGRISRGGILEITGTGNPNGVHAAPIGSVFRNTEDGGWNGARVWRKDSGVSTNANGWVVESGDTDIRALVRWDVSGTLVEGEEIPGLSHSGRGFQGGVFIRRIGAKAHLIFAEARATSNLPEIPVPTGFRPRNAFPFTNVAVTFASSPVNTIGVLHNPTAIDMTSGGVARVRIDAGGVLGSHGSGGYGVSSSEWITDQPWPSTLPGTPA